jgi:hypothetical protein
VNIALLRQLLQAWAAPADALVKAATEAAKCENWPAFVLLLKQLARQDRDYALALLAGQPETVPELLRAWVSSDEQQQQQVMQSCSS